MYTHTHTLTHTHTHMYTPTPTHQTYQVRATTRRLRVCEGGRTEVPLPKAFDTAIAVQLNRPQLRAGSEWCSEKYASELKGFLQKQVRPCSCDGKETSRVCQNYIYTVRIYGSVGREATKYTVKYGIYICIYTVLANTRNFQFWS